MQNRQKNAIIRLSYYQKGDGMKKEICIDGWKLAWLENNEVKEKEIVLKTPADVEKGLNRAIPQKDWSSAHHWLIWHGRKVCHSQKPDCEHCTLSSVCDFYKTHKK